MVAQLLIDLTGENVSDIVKKRLYFKTDQWDGYRTERRAILETWRGLTGVAVLTGDLHASYAGELHPDFDAPGEPVAVEYLVPGISSLSLHEQLEAALETEVVLPQLGLRPVVRRSDAVVKASNPHLRFVQNRAYGYGVFEVNAEALTACFVHLSDVVAKEPPAITRVCFRTPLGRNTIEPR
jgi:phosphodiesterase/alkaline phosphatase D-like protein